MATIADDDRITVYQETRGDFPPVRAFFRDVHTWIKAKALETAAGLGAYFGAQLTDGTWRLIRSSNDLVVQRLESGSWTTKHTYLADTSTGLQILMTPDGTAGIGSNATTHEHGFLVRHINRTGGASVKGTLVSCSTSADREIIKQANEYDMIGVIAESGIAEGSEVWTWCVGSVCQVLYKNSTAATRGNLLIADAVDGRASDIANPGSGLPAVETHFKECGHVMQSANAGTDVLVLASIHFN